MSNISSKIQYAGHHYFIYTTTFGFLGSAVVEVTNASIKSGDHRTRTNMRLDTSSIKHLDQAEAKTFKTNVTMAARMNETMHQTCSLTNDYLTCYMEGIA
eukprot:4464601-Ditylum_brightwellii.AAC.1